MAENPCITIQVDFTDLDKAIAKANELADLLKKASTLVNEIAKKSPTDANKLAALVLGIQERQEDALTDAGEHTHTLSMEEIMNGPHLFMGEMRHD